MTTSDVSRTYIEFNRFRGKRGSLNFDRIRVIYCVERNVLGCKSATVLSILCFYRGFWVSN